MASREILVDAGGWVAVVGREDQHHAQASAFFTQLLRGRRQLVTTNLVVAEAYTVLLRQFGGRVAVQFLDLLDRSPSVERVWSTRDLEIEAEAVLRQYADHDFSYADAVSFAVMRQRGIEEAFTFDQHFVAVGFVVVPKTVS